VAFAWRFANAGVIDPRRSLDNFEAVPVVKHWGKLREPPGSKDEEILVRMGNSKIPTMTRAWRANWRLC
jgi:hypothetical protein